MGAQVPLGQRELQKLEFKGAEALRQPFSLSREIVAMLNADGGELWIGVREDNGFAVEVQDIPDVEAARVSLLNHLIEVVEPQLGPEEVSLTPLGHEGRNVLLVTVHPQAAKRPYALLKDRGRQFLLRVDHRIRTMTREEVLDPRAAGQERPGSSRLGKIRDERLRQGDSGLWVGVEPDPRLDIDVQHEQLWEILIRPTKSGNRAVGWSFRYPPETGIQPVLAGNRVGFGRDGNRKTTIWKDGCIEFWTPLEGLHHRTDAVKEIYPLALLEYPVSIMRLAAHVYDKIGDSKPQRVRVDTALLRLEGWHMPAYVPRTYGYACEHALPEVVEEGQFLPDKALEFAWPDFLEHPDKAGYLLVRSIYQAFHLSEERIPRDYDRVRERLVLED